MPQRSGTMFKRGQVPSRPHKGAAGTHDVKPWGRWATLGLGLIALLIGQLAALPALIWGIRLSLEQIPDLASDGVAVILTVCISTPVQLLVLALMARQTGASATEYLG